MRFSLLKPLACSFLLICTQAYASFGINAIHTALENEFTKNKANNKNINSDKLQQDVRSEYIKKTAFELGVNLGSYIYKKSIKLYLHQPHIKKMLDRNYPFERFVFNENYMPPVIDYQENTASVNPNETVLRRTNFIFKKIKKAKIVLATPSWRDYFLIFKTSSDAPVMLKDYLNSTSTPMFQHELDIWFAQIDRGFEKGLLYIESNFELAINKMDRDFKGYLLFYMLQDQGIIRPVEIKESSKEYVLRKDELRIGDSVFRVLESTFQIDSYIKKLKQQKKKIENRSNLSPQTWETKKEL